MLAIYKRELRSYFVSPIGYVFLGIIIAFSAALFSVSTLLQSSNDVSGYFYGMVIVFMFTMPLLTMKLFSDEKRLKTEQLLLTSPITIGGMVMAKFFAAFTVFCGANILCSISYISLYTYSEPESGIILGNIIALTLVGAMFISIGLFASSFTEHQIVAALITIGIIAPVFLIDFFLRAVIPVYSIREVIAWISPFSRYTPFTEGFFDIAGIVYYASICFVFLFVTCRVYERRRYGA